MKTGKTVCDLYQLEILFLQNLHHLNHDWKATQWRDISLWGLYLPE